MSDPKYPQVRVRLAGEDGNAFAIIARVQRVMRHHSIPKEEVEAFRKEATSGNFDHLLQTVMQWVDTD